MTKKLTTLIAETIRQKSEKPFISKEQQKEIFDVQSEGVSRAIKLMGYSDKADNPPRPLEFFFYADRIEKAHLLALALRKLNYDAQVSPSKGRLFLVSGTTPNMNIEDNSLTAWAEKMCTIALTLDCEFDGWGTLMDWSGDDSI